MNIIEHIWSDTLELREGKDFPPLANILSSLLAAPMICFTTRACGSAAHPIVSYAGNEVLPGTSLADVLFEEFSLEINDQTIVLIEHSDIGNAETLSSRELGQALGQVLVELAGLNQDENLMIAGVTKSDVVHQTHQQVERGVSVSLIQ